MNSNFRYLIAPETPRYGPIWGVMKNLIRNPVPRDPVLLWDGLQTKLPPFWIGLEITIPLTFYGSCNWTANYAKRIVKELHIITMSQTSSTSFS